MDILYPSTKTDVLVIIILYIINGYFIPWYLNECSSTNNLAFKWIFYISGTKRVILVPKYFVLVRMDILKSSTTMDISVK